MNSIDRALLVAFLVLLVVTIVLPPLMGGMMSPGAMQRGEFWMWGVGTWVGGLARLVVWGALIVGAVLVVRHLGGGVMERDVRTSPLDILKRRYASGEITRDQYEQMRKDLE